MMTIEPYLADHTIPIHEIYESVQGEGRWMGTPCVFVRVAGCSLSCEWCDTPEAVPFPKTSNSRMGLRDIVRSVESTRRYDKPGLVCLTGGDPLDHALSWALSAMLADRGHHVQINTGGHRTIRGRPTDPGVGISLDMKAPSSRQTHRMDFDNLIRLVERDELNVVIEDLLDYRWAMREVLPRLSPYRNYSVWFTPSWGKMDPSRLAKWILFDCLPVRLGIQAHKYVWDPEAKGV